jgi:hypothetical protein
MDLKKKQFSLLLHLAAELRKNDDESEEVRDRDYAASYLQ